MYMAPVLKQPRHKIGSIASGDNRGQKVHLLASPQYASIPDPRQNVENNRGRKPLLHWWEDDEGLTPTKDGGTCLRRLSMFRKEVH